MDAPTDETPRPDAGHPAEEETDRMDQSGELGPDRDPAGGDGEPFVVVGLGASAGGLEALEAFFAGLPTSDNAAFVVVIHLAPDRESHLADILERTVPLPVTQVTERVEVRPGHVYVIPPNRNLLMEDGHLRLAPLEDERHRRRPIDHSFRTLAEAWGERAIAVVLSGTGQNGTVGVQRIRELGGLVLAQAPEDAVYDEMPRSALLSGVVDHAATAGSLGGEAIEYAQRLKRVRLAGGDGADGAVELERDDVRAVQRILSLLKTRTGHDFAHYKRSTVLRRLSRRLHVVGVDTLDDYLAYLRRRPGEADELLDDLLISVTNFFRDREAFAVLETAVVPRLFEGKGAGDEVRVWVAGCATGEEAYSVAILLAEFAAGLAEPPQVQVFGTDLSERAVRVARTGVYPESIEADVSPERLRRFFRQTPAGYRVAEELREAVLFAPHSLLKDPPFGHVDLVTCRNLLIYLQRELQTRVLELFHYALRPGGTLFLGSSETAEGAKDLFRTEDKAARIYRRRDVAASLPDLPRRPRVLAVPPLDPAPVEPAGGNGVPPSYAETHRRARAEAAPPSLLVTADRDVVHLSDGAAPFLRLEGGEPTRHVFRLVLPDLRAAVQTGLYQARRTGGLAQSGPVRVEADGRRQSVVVRVRPVGEGDLYQVIFEATEPAAPHPDPTDAEGALADELRETREQLQLTIEEFETSREELQAQNEELQSINEELRSTAEELETAKEEAQSMAEEVLTVNDELKAKVDELAQSKSDVENLVASTEIGTLFLDRDLTIQRFTPHVRKHFHVRASDLGRPLAELAPRFGSAHLVDDAEAVLDELQVKEREVRGEDGRWYLVHVRPYRTVADRIDGVVVTFVDITARRDGEAALRASEERFRALVEASAEVVWTTDAEGQVVEDSPSWRAFTGQTSAEWLGEGWADAVHPDDREAVLADWRRAVAEGAPFERTFRLRVTGDGWRWTHMRAVPLRDEAGAVRGYVGMNTDVTRQREAEAALRQSEARATYRAALAERLRLLVDPGEVQAAAARALGEHLGASRVHYAEMEADGEHALIAQDYAEGVPDRAGRYRMAGFATLHAEAQAGRTFVVSDVQADARLSPEEKAVFAALPVAAVAVVPLVKEGRLHAVFAVHHAAAHAWTAAEVALIEETAERTWEAVARARADEALRQSEERYRLLVESATEYAIVLFDAEGRVTSWSRGAEAVFGYTEAEAFGQHGALLFTPEDRAAGVPEAEFGRAAETGQATDDRWHVRQDGSRLWANGVMTALRRPDGSLRGFAKILRDNTERREAEEALRTSEERFRQAVEAAGLGTWSFSVEEGVSHFDERTREIFGIENGALGPDGVAARIHPDDLEAFVAARERALAPDTPDTFAETHRIVRPDGEARWIRGQARVFFEGDGAERVPVRAVGVVLDVTEQRAAEESLRQSEERFRRTAEAVPDILFTAAPDGQIDYVNARFEEVTGRPMEEALGMTLWDGLIHPDDREAVAAVLTDGRRTEPHEARHRMRTAEGGYCWFLTRAQPVRDGHGEVAAWFGTTTDVDRIVQAEEEVQALNATLERRVRQRTALARRLLARLTVAEEEERKRIAQVLHDDLQQRLYGLGMTLALLRRQPADAALIDRAEGVLDEAAALTRTLATEMSPAVLNTADLNETFEWLVENVRTQYGLDVELDVEPGCEIADPAVRVAVYQVLRELLFNVVKHAGADRARLGARAEDDHVVVTVEDEGAGFDPDVLEAGAGGTGLGLASAQGRLDLVGGRVEVDSAPGRGTRVSLSVPRRPAPD